MAKTNKEFYCFVNSTVRIKLADKTNSKLDFTQFGVDNEEFSLVKIYVQGVGKNRNYSYMSKENITKYLPTLAYAPVVGCLMAETDEEGRITGYKFGGHEYTLTEDLELKPLTVPFGVVIKDTFNFENVEEYGETVEYLTAYAYLWTGRYPELKEAIYSDDVWFNQSMELKVNESRPLAEDSNYIELLDWVYSALCILGKSDDPAKNVEPCFISAVIEPARFALSGTYQKMMDELKNKLSVYFNKSTEGGQCMDTVERDAILAEYGLTLEALGDKVTDVMTADELRNICIALHSDDGDPEQGTAGAPTQDDSDTQAQDGDNASGKTTGQEPAGGASAPSSETSDNDADDSDDDDGFTPVAKKKIAELEMQIEALTKELTGYRHEKIDELLAQFTDLVDVEGYDALVKDAYEMEYSVLEEKLYALRGRNAKPVKFSALQPAPLKRQLHNTSDDDVVEYYGGLIKVKR